MIPFQKELKRVVLVPVFLVECAVGECLGNLRFVDHLLMGKVGDGARDLEDTVIGAGAHPHRVKGAAQKLLCLFGGRAVSSKTSGRNAGIAGDGGARKALMLNLSGSFDPCADLCGAFLMAFSGEGGKLERRYLDMEVNAVQKRTGDAGDVFLYCMRRAGAGDFGVSPIAAGTGIHRCHEHHRTGIGHAGGGAGDCDLVVLNRLAQNLQRLPLEFGQFIQKEHAPHTGTSGLCQTVLVTLFLHIRGSYPGICTLYPRGKNKGVISPH